MTQLMSPHHIIDRMIVLQLQMAQLEQDINPFFNACVTLARDTIEVARAHQTSIHSRHVDV